MNQFTQAALIAPVGCGLDVRRFETAAQSTTSLSRLMLKTVIFGRECEWAYQPFATDGTKPACNWQHCSEAIFTNWQPRNIYQGGTAKTAIGREQRREKTCGDAAGPRDQSIVLRNNPGPGGPNWGPVTAEDDPPSPDRGCGGSDRTNLLQYSGAADRTQRGRVPGSYVCSRSQPALKSCISIIGVWDIRFIETSQTDL